VVEKQVSMFQGFKVLRRTRRRFFIPAHLCHPREMLFTTETAKALETSETSLPLKPLKL
jgi:hypothetical protein